VEDADDWYRLRHGEAGDGMKDLCRSNCRVVAVDVWVEKGSRPILLPICGRRPMIAAAVVGGCCY